MTAATFYVYMQVPRWRQVPLRWEVEARVFLKAQGAHRFVPCLCFPPLPCSIPVNSMAEATERFVLHNFINTTAGRAP